MLNALNGRQPLKAIRSDLNNAARFLTKPDGYVICENEKATCYIRHGLEYVYDHQLSPVFPLCDCLRFIALYSLLRPILPIALLLTSIQQFILPPD